MSRSPLSRLYAAVAVDTTPLRTSRDFRLMWSSLITSEVGSQITTVAVAIHVYRLTESAAALGLVGLARFVPLAIGAIAGGPLIDSGDRRKLLVVAQCGLGAATMVLLAGTLADLRSPLFIYVASAISALFHGIASPTKQAITATVIPRPQLPSAMALNQAAFNGTLVIGPAVGGLVIARFSLGAAYALDIITFCYAIFAAYRLSTLPATQGGGTQVRSLQGIAEGLRFLRGKQILISMFVVDLIAMIFGMPNILFPLLAEQRFGGGEEITGALFAAPALGAVVASLTMGWVRHVRRHGLAVIFAVTVWGLGITAFGLSGSNLALSLVFLVIAGAADVVSAVFRGTILQSTVPDHLRGRLSGINILVVAGGPRLGNFEAGVVAAAFTPTVSVVSGGILTLAGVAVMALGVPLFRRYRVDK